MNKNEYLVGAIFLLMLIFLLVSLGSPASADYCHVEVDAEEDSNSGWSNVALCDDENTGTGGNANNDGDWIIFTPNNPPSSSAYKLTGIKIHAYEKFRPDGNFYADIKIGAVTEASDVDLGKNSWFYYNFSTYYPYNSNVNLTFNRHTAAGKGVINEIEFLFYRIPKVTYSNYPKASDSCVPTNPELWYISLKPSIDSGCDNWVNITYYSNASGSLERFYTHNYTWLGGSTPPQDDYFYYNEFKDYDIKYWYWINTTTWDDYLDEKIYNNITYTFTPQVCLPPELPPAYPCLPNIPGFNPDCWEMISAFHPDGFVNIVDWSIHNTTNDTKITFNNSVAHGDIWQSVYAWNSSNNSYYVVTNMYNHVGYWFYRYNNSCNFFNYIQYVETGIAGQWDYSIPGSLEKARAAIEPSVNWDGESWATGIFDFQINRWFYNVSNLPDHVNNTDFAGYDCVDFVNNSYTLSIRDDWTQGGIATTSYASVIVEETDLVCGVGGCDFPIYVNYSDANLTINVTINDCAGTNTTNVTIDEDALLWIAGWLNDNTGFILLAIGLFFWFAENKSDMVLYWITSFIAMTGSIWYLTAYSYNILGLETWIGISLMLFGLYCIYLGFRYGIIMYGRKK